jgi:hypothetical protein
LELPGLSRELNVIEEFLGTQIRRWCEKTGNLHERVSRILQHMNTPLRKEHGAALLYRFYDSVDHDPPSALEDVNDLFAVRVRVGRTYGLPWIDFDHAHAAVLRIHVILRDDPTQVSTGKVERFDTGLVNNRQFHGIYLLFELKNYF